MALGMGPDSSTWGWAGKAGSPTAQSWHVGTRILVRKAGSGPQTCPMPFVWPQGAKSLSRAGRDRWYQYELDQGTGCYVSSDVCVMLQQHRRSERAAASTLVHPRVTCGQFRWPVLLLGPAAVAVQCKGCRSSRLSSSSPSPPGAAETADPLFLRPLSVTQAQLPGAVSSHLCQGAGLGLPDESRRLSTLLYH